MKLKDKINVKKALIVFPIIIVLIGGMIIGAFSSLFASQEGSIDSNAVAKENLEDVIKDEKALKILDIHENLPLYIDKEVVLEGYFISLDDKTKVFGVEVPLGNGSMTMTSLTYELSDPNLLKDITETSLVKVSGAITSFDQLHQEEGQDDHTHTIPKLNVKSVEVIR